MSDKHTDAQGELLGAIDDLIGLADTVGKSRQANSYALNSAAVEKLVDLKLATKDKITALFRATEGQAQTSAAVDEKPAAYRVTSPNTGTSRLLKGSAFASWERSGYIVTPLYERAAQSADSTAPGAPEKMSVVFDNILRIQRAEAEAAPHDGYMRGLYNGMSMMCANIDCDINWMPLAAPTAQQSLTANGAVPDERELFESLTLAKYAAATFERFTYGKYKTTWVQDHYEGWCMARAAAPLPQVQSEALDAARWRAFVGSQRIKPQGSAGLNTPQPNNYAHMGLEIWTTYDRDYPQNLLDRMDAENATGRDWLTKYADIAIAAQRAANQQPVTPSGALADNDGGVA